MSKPAVKPIPDGMRSLTPYLTCAGAAGAIEFYKKAFNAVEVSRTPNPQDKLLNARILLAAMNDVAPSESGLASGIVNTAFMMGGALGLAALASLASARTNSLLTSSDVSAVALHAGYQLAFIAAAAFSAMAAVLGAVFLRDSVRAASPDGEIAIGSNT